MLVDTHAHLDDPQFDADRAAVIARAAASGLRYIVTVGTDLDSSRQALELAQRFPGVYAAVGFHPHEAKTFGADSLDRLRRLAAHPDVVALGEMGLDFYRNLSPRQEQRQAFERQLSLAAELGLPVIVHSRQAHGEVLDILQRWAGRLGPGRIAGVMHCFSGDEAMARRFLELGFFISLAGPVTFGAARRLRDLAAALPLEGLVLETDCPYLAPEPFRGQRNEPARVRAVAEEVAALRGLSLRALAHATTANAQSLFRLQGRLSLRADQDMA